MNFFGYFNYFNDVNYVLLFGLSDTNFDQSKILEFMPI